MVVCGSDRVREGEVVCVCTLTLAHSHTRTLAHPHTLTPSHSHALILSAGCWPEPEAYGKITSGKFSAGAPHTAHLTRPVSIPKPRTLDPKYLKLKPESRSLKPEAVNTET